MAKWNINRNGPNWLMDAIGRIYGYRDRQGGEHAIPQMAGSWGDAEVSGPADASLRVLSGVSGDGMPFFPDAYRGAKSPSVVFGDPISIGDYSAVSGSPTLSIETGPNGRPALKIVTGVGVHSEVNFPNIAGSAFDGEVYVLLSGGYSENVSSVGFYATPDADYSTNFTVSSYTPLAAPSNSGVEPGGSYVVRLDRANRSATGTITYPFPLTTHKLRITPLGGQSATVFIYGIGFAPQPTKGRIAVICDDGYDSWFRLGQPIMQSRGIPVTCAVIPVSSNAGNGAFYLRQLQGFIHAGNAVVAHGPNTAGGVGSLLSAYTNTADRVADMIAVRKWIADNGLAVKGYESCYVWPQGFWQSGLTDLSLLDAALQAGFTTGRAANGRSAGLYGNFDALSKYQHLTLPIAGHTWAGTTAAESTNITAIVALIDAAAAQGADITLMLHRVQATATVDGSMNSIGIRVSDLTTLAAAIAAKVTAGTLQAVTLPQLALARSGGFWQL